MSWLSRLRNAMDSRSLEQDLADEMRDHLEHRAASLREQGLSPEEARRHAAVRFGNVTRIQESSRDHQMLAGVEHTILDIRYAWRLFRKNPGFTATAVLSLALAIGANTSIFSIVDAAMLRALPVHEPQQLFTLAMPGIADAGGGSAEEGDVFSYQLYLKFRQSAEGAARLAVFGLPVNVEVQPPGGQTENATREFVSGDAFEMLGVRPAVGRVFSHDDDRIPGQHPVAVIGYNYWRSHFGGDSTILGRDLEIDGKHFSIVGVAREGFFGIEPGKMIDIWVPSMMCEPKALRNMGWAWFRVVGRLEQGATKEQIQARFQPAFRDYQEERVKDIPTMPPAIQKQFRDAQLRVYPGERGVSAFRQDYQRPLWIVLAVALIILVIACSNVASLILARSTVRATEMAMRLSLGAGRGRLVRQLLLENLMLAMVAGGLGWLLALLSAPLLMNSLVLNGEPVKLVLALNTRVLLFCIGVSTVAALLFGLAPAWQAAGARPIEALRSSSGQAGKLRLGRFFVSVQVAFAFCLVMAGAAFLFSLRNLQNVDTGFSARGVAVLNIATGPAARLPQANLALMTRLQSAVAAQPSVQGAAVTAWPFFEFDGWSEQILLDGKKPSEREELFYRVSPGYFATLGTRLLSGRDFEPRDATVPGARPAIVNQSLVRAYFDGKDPIGKTFRNPSAKIPYVIVGVAADSYYGSLRKGAVPIAYVPPAGENAFTLYVRSSMDPGSVARIVEREAGAIGSGLRVKQVRTLETMVGNTIQREKLLAGIGGAFALLGLLLAAIGLFGLLNYSVARRTKEIGIRAALGAGRKQLLALVLKDLVAMVGGGLAAGVAGSLGLMTFAQALLFGIKPLDPLVMGTAAVVFLIAAFVAAGLPARRAASVDPMIALRYE